MIRINVSGKELRKCLKGLTRVIPGKSTLPILRSVLLQAKAGMLTATATNLDEYVSYSFSTAVCDADVMFLVDIGNLKPIAAGDEAGFEVGRKKINVWMLTNGQRIARSFIADDAGEFPAVPATAPTVPAPQWLDCYQRAAPFASSDETRYVLNSVYTDIDERGNALVVATDGKRLITLQTPAMKGQKSFIAPTTKFLLQARPAEAVGIGVAEGNDCRWISVVSDGWSYAVKAIEATYPNYRQVIPHPPASCNTIIFDERDNVAGLLKCLPGGKDQIVILNRWRKSGLVITDSGDAESKTVAHLKHSTFRGNDSAVGLNAGYVSQALSAGFREFRFEDELTPLLSVDGQGGLMVIMPVRINSSSAARKAA